VTEASGSPAHLPAPVVEVLGGTPRNRFRGPSPGWRLPPALRRRVVSFDRRVDTAFDRLRGRRSAVDRTLYALSALGDFSLLWHLLGAAKGLRSERDFHGAVRLAVGLGVESVLVNGAVKSLFRRHRPPWEGGRPYRLRLPHTSSFPSGHASSGFFAASLLADGDPAWRVTYLLAALVAASRIHVRIHHASDVVGGAVLGLLLGGAVRRAAPLPPEGGES
jgi:membrane-associated phospholipid phosphatase